MNYESLIFDIDGTLWDSRGLVAQGYNLQLHRENLDRLAVTAEDLRPLFGKILPQIADVIFAEIPVPERYALMDRCAETEDRLLHDDPCEIGYPGVKEALEALSQKHRLFIVSNSQSGYPELCMNKLGIGDYITGHLCHGDTGTSKGQTIRTLMERYSIESAAYVGDTQGDFEATLEADIPFIWAAYGFGKPAGYVEKISEISQLLQF